MADVLNGRDVLSWLRSLHRVSAQVLGSALLLYAVTGALMIYQLPTAAGLQKGWEVERFRVDVPKASNPEAAALVLATVLAPRERIDEIQTDHAGSRVRLRRPGRRTTITVAAGARQAEVEVKVPDLATRAGGLHGQRKYRGGPAFVLWAALADGAAVALLLFATSGVLLAWRIHPRRTIWVFSAASAFTLTAIFQLWLQP